MPVFPLPGALLLPGGKLPLNIFEPRYLALVEDSLAAGRMFGMVQPDPAAQRMPGGAGVYGVGCVGRLSSFSETDDGRYLISLSGVIRFRIEAELPLRRGYRCMQVDYTEWWADLDRAVPPALKPTMRDGLMQALRRYFAQRGFDANWSALQAMTDDTLVSTLCMACPFDPREKQLLLEAHDLAARAEALSVLLQIGAVPDPKETRPQ